jgi:tRNA (guanine-N7-)-methyltransferase
VTAGEAARERAPKPYADVPGFPSEGSLDLVSLAGGAREIELEVGFGRGKFAVERAACNGGAFLLAIETRRKYVHTAAEWARKLGLSNVLFRYGDARAVIARLAPDASVSRIFVNFPDPWWKARHMKRAVVGSPLVGEAARLLAPGGEMFVQTDVEERAAAFKEVLEAEPRLVPAAPGGFVVDNPYGASSNRERRCVEAEVPIFRLLYRRS